MRQNGAGAQEQCVARAQTYLQPPGTSAAGRSASKADRERATAVPCGRCWAAERGGRSVLVARPAGAGLRLSEPGALSLRAASRCSYSPPARPGAGWGQRACRASPALIAVGTALAGRPPHRSERAALPHSALALGSDVEPLLGPGMQDARPRYPALGKRVHAHPGHPAGLAASLQRLSP